MKISEFRKLIREEVRKIIKEGIIETLQVDPKVISVNYDDNEGLLDAVKAKYKVKLMKVVKSADNSVSIYSIGSTSYFLADEEGFGVMFKTTDLAKVLASIKDGSYFKMI